MLPARIRVVDIAVRRDHLTAKGPDPLRAGGFREREEGDEGDGGGEEEAHGRDRTRGTAREAGLVAVLCVFVTVL
jgi:hypothetical protein